MSSRLEPKPLPRRDFLGLAGLWTTAIAIVGSLVGMFRLPNPAVLPEQSNRFRIGRPEDFPPGTARVIPGQRVLVVANGEGLAAISMVCTHLGCIVARTSDGFTCPCHGSAFDGNGQVIAGPAPRGLRWLQVARAVDGRLVVDADREVTPGTFLKA